jgi:hypothetical protein
LGPVDRPASLPDTHRSMQAERKGLCGPFVQQTRSRKQMNKEAEEGKALWSVCVADTQQSKNANSNVGQDGHGSGVQSWGTYSRARGV